MDTRRATAAWQAVVVADPAEMDRAGIGAAFESVMLVRSMCDALEIGLVARSKALAATGNSEPPESILATESGRSGRDARRATARETACEIAPSFHEALADGAMTTGHLDAAATVIGRLEADVATEFATHAPDLIERAGRLDVDQFAQECRDLARFVTAQHDEHAEEAELDRQRRASTVRRWQDEQTGMRHTLISLDPLRDSAFWKVVNAQTETLRQQQRTTPAQDQASFGNLQARAIIDLVTTPPTSTDATPTAALRVPEISVHVDWQLLSGIATRNGLLCETDSGVTVPVATVRRMCCDADVFPVVLGADGVVLDQGRGIRTANRDQRRALAAMHSSCAFPTCDVTFDACRIHHVRFWWEHRGPTDMDNLLPLCERHHHLVHEGGWCLTMTPDRVATWCRPDGVTHHRGQTMDRRPADVPMRT